VTYAAVKSMDLSHDNKLATRQRFGATTTKEPVRVDFTETKIRLTMDLENDNLITALTADTAADLTVTFTNAANRTIQFTLTGAYISDYSDSTSGPGLLEASVEFTGQFDGTTNPLKIVILNSQSTGILA
jgi:type VI protein secretion system component Hcp